MSDQHASGYSVDFNVKTRDYQLHQKLPIILMQRFVPAHTLSWLAKDAELINELSRYLSGDDSYQGALREMIQKAEGESVKQNLLSGPRTRFTTARRTPLIERLMQGLRLLLEESRLTLNRAGAHGWIYDGKAWFVSKRIADEVRKIIIEHESAEGLPGKDKNDRFFDTWQEYGALISTPDGRAVHHVNVVLDDGWEQPFTVICFPLAALYRSPERYPAPVKGRILPMQTATTAPAATLQADHVLELDPVEIDLDLDLAEPTTPTTDSPPLAQAVQASISSTTDNAAVVAPDNIAKPKPDKPRPKPDKPATPWSNPALAGVNIKALLKQTSPPDKTLKQVQKDTTKTAPEQNNKRHHNNKKTKEPETSTTIETVSATTPVMHEAPQHAESVTPTDYRPPADDIEAVDVFLDPVNDMLEDPAAGLLSAATPPTSTAQASPKIAAPENRSETPDSSAPQAAKKPRRMPPPAMALKPVAPAGQSQLNMNGFSRKKNPEPHPAALSFMRWIQEGLAQGTLPYNRTDAMIHFIPEGMMLVSPIVFRKFAEAFGENGDGNTTANVSGSDLGKGIQRHVCNAGWHQTRGAEKLNIHRFVVTGSDGAGRRIIAGMLIPDPARFVNPLPVHNPCISTLNLDNKS